MRRNQRGNWSGSFAALSAALLIVAGCSSTPKPTPDPSTLPNAHLRETDKMKPANPSETAKSVDPLGAAAATGSGSLPARSTDQPVGSPTTATRTLGVTNPAPGPAGGSQVPAPSGPSVNLIPQVTANPTISSPNGAVGIVGDATTVRGAGAGEATTAGATVGGVGAAGTGIGVAGRTSPAGATITTGVGVMPQMNVNPDGTTSIQTRGTTTGGGTVTTGGTVTNGTTSGSINSGVVAITNSGVSGAPVSSSVQSTSTSGGTTVRSTTSTRTTTSKTRPASRKRTKKHKTTVTTTTETTTSTPKK